MKKVIKAPAKINLALKVNAKRSDGYHDLVMVMQSISIYDTMEIEITKDGEFDLFGFVKLQKYIMRPFRGLKKIDLNFLKQFVRKAEDLEKERQINLKCNFNYIPTDEKNLIVKIIKYVFEKYGIKDKIFIYLKKLIPTGAGLGGGSSDAAEILLFLNKYYKLNLSIDELVDISLKFGSDIPFFLYKHTCICRGRGEIIVPLDSFNNYYILLATPDVRVSTKEVYETYDKKGYKSLEFDDKKIEKIVYSIKNKKYNELYSSVFNDLEQPIVSYIPEIEIFKQKMKSYGANASLMSGSGPTVYGLFSNYFKANKCKDMLKKEYKNAFVFVAKPI